MANLGFEQTPVLIVGGGLVGLSAGLFLEHHRAPFLLIERMNAASPLPRSRGIAPRTMELFRLVGLQEKIEAVARSAWKQGSFGGARRGRTMLSSEALPLPDISTLRAAMDASPAQMTACPQTLIEPVLRRVLEERAADVRFGWELLHFEQDHDHVTATVRDPAGAEQTIMASYVIAADGSRSGIRRDLNIDRQGLDADRFYLNVFFEADLTSHVEGRTFSQCEIANETVSGLFLAMNNTTEWSFHLQYDPAHANPELWSDAHISDLVKAAIGAGNLPVALRHRAPWNTRVRIAERYRERRIFLIGDAAHLMPPWGGFNANTGIADAHNLAWKLAGVLDGSAGPELLDSYETERQPVARRNGEQARLRADFDARFNLRTEANAADLEHMRDYGELQMRYRYGANDTVPVLRAQPGTRFPHAWIAHQGQRRSTLDLFGTSYVRIGGRFASKAEAGVCYRAGIDFEFIDDGVNWSSLTERADSRLGGADPAGETKSAHEHSGLDRDMVGNRGNRRLRTVCTGGRQGGKRPPGLGMSRCPIPASGVLVP